ncbi:hypothetical protein FVF58_09340 [Paraburkholderia panacisoli]|uniref:Uncharacterized protein n=1 Tax=Paraburkholderia panacisoli TaxID=2603818 RepID=A0A5B0HCR4_9BURK|nr:hypothetical protein [Paraburkholderia panacisoli]KAA1012987.1 hypothetical protein FVF58_09340 [Paraburkholderia panacisoli]
MSDWVEILRHTIGADQYGHIRHDRNYFITGEGGKDWLACVGLVSAGYMTSRKGNAATGGDDIFFATRAGREFVQLNNEPAPEPRKRTKADEWRDRDGCESFGEFLTNGRLPVFEQRQAYGNAPRDRYGYEYRMYRYEAYPYDYRRDVEGEWCGTKKEAKASYKAALKERQRASA